MNLSKLQSGESGIITKIKGRGAFRKRILEMGFVKGKEVTVIKNAPLKDPIEYKVMGYNISLRRNEAELIEIVTPEELKLGPNDNSCADPDDKLDNWRFKRRFAKKGLGSGLQRGKKRGWKKRWRIKEDPCGPRAVHEQLVKGADDKSRVINVALVGNPNSGKTTFFNIASGAKERVGNYSGVTVEAKEATLHYAGYTINLVDLPGTYSITEYSPEELFVREYIITKTPDVVVNILDSSNLERNLYLTTQLIDMDVKVVAALNMFDEMEKMGDFLDIDTLGKLLGVPFVPTVSSRGEGIDDLFKRVIEVYEDIDGTMRHIHINYGNEIEKSISKIQKYIHSSDNYVLTNIVSSRFVAIKLLEKDKQTEDMVFEKCENRTDIIRIAREEILRLEGAMKDDTESLITDAKYGFIAGALTETSNRSARPQRTQSERIDRFLTNKFLGFPIFLVLLWATFQMTFAIGEYPMNWIDQGVSALSGFIASTMPEGLLKDLLVDGIIAGVGGVIVFLPNILILFFMISLMDDTGYMARAAFIMDKLMHKIGLHGKSFIPMIMGFGCSVPAVMATRTIESRNDRLLTMLILPFMSCSARLPVYVLIIGAFFKHQAGTMLFVIYLVGILMAVLSGVFLKKILFKTSDLPFVMELPPYRRPQLVMTIRHMWEKGVEYLKKIGGVILVASIIIWALGKFPQDVDYSKDYDNQIKSVGQEYTGAISKPGVDEQRKKELKKWKEEHVSQLELQKAGEKLEKSFIGIIGQFVQPVMGPLGFDWKMSVSVFTGLAAKEIVVGTMGVLYHADENADEESETLRDRLRTQVHTSGKLKGQNVFTPLVAFVFVLFILIYSPCIGVVATIKRESGSWKWAAFSVIYSTILAWIVSFLVYQVGKLIV